MKCFNNTVIRSLLLDYDITLNNVDEALGHLLNIRSRLKIYGPEG